MKNWFHVVGLLMIGLLVCWPAADLSAQRRRGKKKKEKTTAVADLSSIRSPLTTGYIPVLQARIDSLVLPVADFLNDPADLKYVVPTRYLSPQLSRDKSHLTLFVRGVTPPILTLDMNVAGQTLTIPVKAPNMRRLQLRIPDAGYTRVAIQGDMNTWNPGLGEMVLDKEIGMWQISFDLEPGDYQYQVVINGRITKDPANTLVSPVNPLYSLVQIPKPPVDSLPALYTRKHDDGRITVGTSKPALEVLALWQNTQLDVKQGEQGSWSFNIPREAASMSRSWIRVYAYNQFGMGNDLLIPLEKGMVVVDPDDLDRKDREAQIMYFVLVDRFVDGNPGNNEPLKDKRVDEKANYQGGDLAGITKKIQDGYFESLNVNALWISPITQNPEEAWQEYPEPKRWYSGYHGYWPVSSSKIDHRFGTDAEMTSMVTEAHNKDINVLLDYVCNHVHQNHPMVKQHPNWSTPLFLPDGRKNIRFWDEYRLTTWFDDFIPTLDLENPEVVAAQTDSTIYWLKKYNLDGYRHDATKHIPELFWRTLTRKLKEQVMIPERKPIYQIGETYGSRPLIKSYLGPGLLDAQFDFNLYFDAREVFGKDSTPVNVLTNSLKESFQYYGYHSSMGYITGNHDQARFISLASGSIDWAEDHREAGWKRKIGPGTSVGHKKLRMLTAFLFSIPGVPVIFYGDEIGMPGAGDPDCRRMMHFTNLDKEQQKTFEITQKLSSLRASRMSLLYGDTEILFEDATVLVLARTYFDELSLFVMNKGKTPRSVKFQIPERFKSTTLKSQFRNKLVQKDRQCTLVLPGGTFDLFIND